MDMTDSGMESLALLLYYINSKELESYIYESLKDWSSYSEERKQEWEDELKITRAQQKEEQQGWQRLKEQGLTLDPYDGEKK